MLVYLALIPILALIVGALLKFFGSTKEPGFKLQNGCPAANEAASQTVLSRRHGMITDLHEKHGDTFAVGVGKIQNVYIRNPADIKKVLTSTAFGESCNESTKFQLNPHEVQKKSKADTELRNSMNLVKPMARGTVFDLQDPVEWRKARATISPSFGVVDKRLQSFERSAGYSVQDLPKETQEHFDLQYWLLATAEGFAVNYATGDRMKWTKELREGFAEAARYFEQRFVADGFAGLLDEDTAVFKRMYDLCLPTVRAALAEGHAEGPDVLSLLINAGQTSEEEITKTVVNMFVAGAESPAAAMTATLRRIRSHPEIQERIASEADKWFETIETKGVSMESMECLEFTKQCAMEGLRLFAPATLVMRSSKSNVEVGGFQWKAGTDFCVCIESVNMDPKQWDEPKEFQPDRWSNSKVPASRFSFATFSHGKRGCPGKNSTLVQLQVAFAHFFRRYRIEVPTESEDRKGDDSVQKWVKWDIHGCDVKLIPRS